jgi:hypothetical protein
MRVSAATESGTRMAVGEGGDQAASEDVAGRLLGRLSVLPALLAMAWLLAGLPLLLLGAFTPALMLVVSIPLAVAAVALGLRWIPSRWPGPRPDGQPDHARAPWWAVASVVVRASTVGVD